MDVPLIDNGKSPEAPLLARGWPGLPHSTSYGNFGRMYAGLFLRIDEANRLIRESFRTWTVAKSDPWNTERAAERHEYVVEQAIFMMRRAADILVTMNWCLYRRTSSGQFPKKLRVSHIDAGLKMHEPLCIMIMRFTHHASAVESMGAKDGRVGNTRKTAVSVS